MLMAALQAVPNARPKKRKLNRISAEGELLSSVNWEEVTSYIKAVPGVARVEAHVRSSSVTLSFTFDTGNKASAVLFNVVKTVQRLIPAKLRII